MKETTFVVLSDLHIDSKAHPDSWDLAKSAFNSAAKTKVDHVIICGDVFDGADVMKRDRQRVRRFLKRLGLWHRDRLSVVVGNHDIFYLAGRSSRLGKLGRFLKSIKSDAQPHYDMFSSWIDDLVGADDRLLEDDIFPFRKDLNDVTLIGTDTTSYNTWYSTNGYWRLDDDHVLRKNFSDNANRCVLAMHHPPYSSDEESLLVQVKKEFTEDEWSFGFPPDDFKRLVRLSNDMRIDAILCGHIHNNGGDPWTWRVGKRTRAFMMGRTGGMDGARPSIGLLHVPRRGALHWRTDRVTAA